MMTRSAHAGFADTNMQAALAAMQTGEFSTASKKLLTALTFNPSVEGYILLSECLMNLNSVDAAIGNLESAEQMAQSTGRLAEVDSLIAQRRALYESVASRQKNEVSLHQTGDSSPE
ncbi:MAG: hypothetical protein ACRD3W_32035 [Terriglobales bacterium]